MVSIDEAMEQDDLLYYNELPQMPQGVRESINAVGPHLAMPAIFAITPAIGMLATGVRVLIHGKPSQLNLISYIAGDFASGKGSIDPIVAAWLAEVKMVDKGYLQAEEEWRARKRAAKNKKEQPEDPKYPVRCLTLNTTVANLADRLANTQGKHAFSFTPEADTVAQKWRTAMSDFSVMLRQAYDGTPYDREAKSAEAVNVHIDKLLWNVVMCGTPDALYRVITNYTDGFQSRVALARTPDNTFSPLSESLFLLTEHQQMKIQQVAHLLPLMSGDVDLPKLEKKGRDWLERIRIDAQKLRQDQGAPALPHLPHGHAHDDLPDALSCGRADDPKLRRAGSGDAAEGRARPVEDHAAAPADAADARRLRRAGRLHDRQRHALLPRAHRDGISIGLLCLVGEGTLPQEQERLHL